MKSWDAYYDLHEGALLDFHRLNIYLNDSASTVHELLKLGYTEGAYSEHHTRFELFLEIGHFCFTSTFEGEDNEIEIPVIEIQHQPPRKHITRLSTGLCFMEKSSSKDEKAFVNRHFGLSHGAVHSVCLFEGEGHYAETKEFQET